MAERHGEWSVSFAVVVTGRHLDCSLRSSSPFEMFGYKISAKDYFPLAPLLGDSDHASDDAKLFKPLALP